MDEEADINEDEDGDPDEIIIDDDQDEDTSGMAEDDTEEVVDTRWYKKAALFVDHVGAVSKHIYLF
eukprot:scaffold22627_cov137-Amphora_coffeaeformis.AAC.1